MKTKEKAFLWTNKGNRANVKKDSNKIKKKSYESRKNQEHGQHKIPQNIHPSGMGRVDLLCAVHLHLGVAVWRRLA